MFHVFVEGAKDGSPAGLDRLVKAMAAHYGLPPADIGARLASGRFRAKGNCDRATAEQYARDLERLGARCTIEPAAPGNRESKPSLLPATKPVPPAKPSTTNPPQFSSGLSAAFSTEHAPADLGAFDKLGSASLSLASVDGSEGAGEAQAAFTPPIEDTPAPPPKQPAAAAAAAPKKPQRPKDEPLDLFEPPDSGGDALVLALAPEEEERAAKKRASVPPATEPAPAAPAPRISAPSLPPVTSVAPARRGNPLGDERVRYVAGVLLAIVLGFVPAHIIASVREKAAYAAVDREVESAQHDAQTPDTYETLDARRADLLGRKYDDRRGIAVTALLIWAACGAGLAFVWFRKIPWDRVS